MILACNFETYFNSVLVWELSKNCLAENTINLVKKSLEKLDIKPKIFYSDHGVQYANFNFEKFLEDNNIIQSMSMKDYALGNKTSEYWFSQLQREKLNLYNYKNWNYLEVKKMNGKYVSWYNQRRVQPNLKL